MEVLKIELPRRSNKSSSARLKNYFLIRVILDAHETQITTNRLCRKFWIQWPVGLSCQS
jgi:hypothetical protein